VPGYKQKIFDDALLDELISYIEAGNYVPTACAAVGLGSRTYYNWLHAGQEVEDFIGGRDDAEDLRERILDGELVLGLSPVQVRSFVVRERILKASARSEAFAVAMVRKQMPDQWTAAMTFLERRFPNRWKRKEQIDIGDADAAQTGIDETLLLNDPTAQKLIHDALDRVARGAIGPAPEPVVVDAQVVDDVPAPAHDDARTSTGDDDAHLPGEPSAGT
jgi:hypothetical protein